MNSKYKTWVESEDIGNRKLAYLLVSHNGNCSTGIKIEDPISEIPLIINALQYYLTSITKSCIT